MAAPETCDSGDVILSDSSPFFLTGYLPFPISHSAEDDLSAGLFFVLLYSIIIGLM